MTLQTDVVIVGGGPIGASLALLLSASGKCVVLLEARAAGASDLRTLAISHGSALLLERLGVSMAALGATAIETIHVSQHGGFGRTRIRACETKVPALGYVISYGHLTAALDARLSQSTAVARYGARVTAVGGTEKYAFAEYTQDAKPAATSASLLVLADGGRGVSPLPGIEVREQDYGQHALVASVTTEPSATTTAYERFTPRGPLALLPNGRDYALIWTVPTEEAQPLIDKNEEEFLHQLDEHFGAASHRFVAIGARASYPLKLRHAKLTGAKRMVLVGNAAQTLHPVAGQGFNLGMRDAWTLARTLADQAADELGSTQALARYRAERGLDVRGAVAITDFLVRAFSNDNPWLSAARGAALATLDLLPPGRAWFARKMMFGSRG
jgi:2-octaprenyl-6-methoxyphenol hydroxylase